MKNLATTTKKITTAAAAISLTLVSLVPLAISIKTLPSFASPKLKQPVVQIAMEEPETLKNLQEAYNGESNAHVRYLAYAEKAEEEGYGQVASLFRAAARAEEIHRDNHAAVIRQMGGTPQNEIETPLVKSTLENLQASIEGESYERDVMYPQFLEEANKAGNKEAVRTFQWAMKAEAEHAKYYQEASSNLAAWKGESKAFYVCPECGFTTAVIDFENCPKCGEPKEEFEEIV
jgi:rubrerythrin